MNKENSKSNRPSVEYTEKKVQHLYKKIIFAVLMLIVFGGLLISAYMQNNSLKSDVRDLRIQLAASRQSADTFYIMDSIPVWKERVVEVDKTDYKRLLADKELIKELKLKVSQIEAENRLLMGMRDTVFLHKDSDSVLRYSDKWADFAYYEDKKKLEYSVRDSLTTFISREYKHRFLWFKWGTKGYNVHHVNHNPRFHIYYNKYIRVKK